MNLSVDGTQTSKESVSLKIHKQFECLFKDMLTPGQIII